MMVVAVHMDAERHVRDEAAAWRLEVVELGIPAEAIGELDRDGRGSGRQGSRRVRAVRRSDAAPARREAREARRAR